jgi:type VI protein secretion system component Hcp
MYIYVDFGEPISDYCEAQSFSFGMQVSRVAGGPSHRAQSHDVSFSKEIDSLSNDLFLSCVNGTNFSSITIEIWATEKACSLMYTMKNALIVSYQRAASGKIESISLDSESISHRYFS